MGISAAGPAVYAGRAMAGCQCRAVGARGHLSSTAGAALTASSNRATIDRQAETPCRLIPRQRVWAADARRLPGVTSSAAGSGRS